MNVLGLLLALVFGALLSSCQQAGFSGPNPHEQKTDDIHQAISALYDRFTYGIAENPCLTIGAEQTENCFYVITIDKNHDDKGVYQGKFAVRVCTQNRRSGNPFEQCDEAHWKPAMHRFKVNGTPDLNEGSDYDLYSQPPSDVLTCHDPNTPDGRPATTCVERTTDLPLVP